jgi:transcriptional regulator with XRE-family HTH domain
MKGNTMPRKTLRAEAVPTLVQERLRMWGNCIRQQRITQGILAEDLCSRMEISDATLRRLEKGDPGAGVSLYLSALLILGVLDEAVPVLANHLWVPDSRRRVRIPATEAGDVDF